MQLKCVHSLAKLITIAVKSFARKQIWNLISIKVHAILSLIQLLKSCSVSIPNIPKPAIRKSCSSFDISIIFYSFDGETFETIHLSHFSHQHTHGLANYKGKALTTGCQEYDNCSVATEILDMHTLQWQNGTDYPFSPTRIYRYSTASTPDAAYIIGGRYTQDIIAEFKEDKWRQAGTLQQGRQQHGSISFGSDTMVVGGSTADYK